MVTGAELMVELKRTYADTEFIIITAHASIRSAVETTRQGGLDYLVKPFDPEEMLVAVRNAMASRKLTDEVRHHRSKSMNPSARLNQFMQPGSSPAMRKALAMGRMAAKQQGVLLLTGESGTGKNYFARWVHAQSTRSGGPFLLLNCAALPRELAESELFGHEPGAFTGAKGRRRGMLELAHGGTLVLDEIGDLELSLQSKLLSVLDSMSFSRVGGEKSVVVDTRLIACTNQDLERSVKEGRFREDLFYRLNVFPIRVPPLRERRKDIPVLIRELVADLSTDMGATEPAAIERSALELLSKADWPGNIRELRNMLERALMLSEVKSIRLRDLPQSATDTDWRIEVPFPDGNDLHAATARVAKELILEALRRGKTKQGAAKLLGISRHALAHQMKTLDLDS